MGEELSPLVVVSGSSTPDLLSLEIDCKVRFFVSKDEVLLYK